MIEGLNKRYRPNRTLYRSLCAWIWFREQNGIIHT
jgi:hypothetical protein